MIGTRWILISDLAVALEDELARTVQRVRLRPRGRGIQVSDGSHPKSVQERSLPNRPNWQPQQMEVAAPWCSGSAMSIPSSFWQGNWPSWNSGLQRTRRPWFSDQDSTPPQRNLSQLTERKFWIARSSFWIHCPAPQPEGQAPVEMAHSNP